MNTETISIHTDYIQLDQLLKYANILATGGQIKELLAEELITLNGTIVTEKRKKIYPNDVVSIGDEISITVVKEA
ncbi:RNA-binding S4 domain-containing protein [Veillonella sp. CHU740]|uniref:RNA-binding S4 domain-containing protein n=1 Tax=Veillonella sp. CHU740 TaxID=2490950 RepID=UPI000F8D4442|nr:RNA-binding S4 domain-containing protein [Veillonella sp. CHU740]